MKNLCIYVIYDKQKKINPYIKEVLKELKKFITDIIVVCNFQEIVSGEEYILPYAKAVIFRENIGYDAGAYKDVIVNQITWKTILSYDELLLTNDTYFAPIYPFDDMFNCMKKVKCDYWGITKHPEGTDLEIGKFNAHIQSYFLYFKKNVFHSMCFKRYWNDYTFKENKSKTVLNFEIGLNDYLNENGYMGMSYMECSENPFSKEIETNPYLNYIYELISEVKIPIIKKISLNGNNRWLINTYMAMDYIEKNTNYNIKLINSYVEEYRKKGLLGTYYDFSKMEKFVQAHSKIYIYGAGVWGEITAEYFAKKNWKYEEIVVSKPNKKNFKLFSDITLNENDGVIIAQEYKNICDEIIDYIGDKCKRSQIFTPCYVE